MIERVGRRLAFIGKVLLIMAASGAAAAFAQTSSPPSATGMPTFVTAAAPPVFAAATIKPAKSGSGGSHSDFNNGRFSATNILLKSIMEYSAYGIPEPRIVGGPKWLDSERFDIEATTDSSFVDRLKTLSRDQYRLQMQAMFQQLLADRFKLKVHWETRELPVYVLTVVRNGPTLTKAKQPEQGLGTSSGNGLIGANGATLADIAQVLTQEAARELGRVVIDKTGIEGKYDIKLKWTPDNGANTANGGADSGPSIFTAIQEQLGLKLESTKGPVQVLVIDHVEMPSEN